MWVERANGRQVLRNLRILFLSRWPFTVVALSAWVAAVLIAFYLLLEYDHTAQTRHTQQWQPRIRTTDSLSRDASESRDANIRSRVPTRTAFDAEAAMDRFRSFDGRWRK